jgi:hypothetical protein
LFRCANYRFTSGACESNPNHKNLRRLQGAAVPLPL